MPIQTVADVTPVQGRDVIPGDRLWTEHGWSAQITHFVTPPPGSFAARYFGEGTRIPFHGAQPLKQPLAPGALVAVKTRQVA